MTREERIGLNEALFREVNERIGALGATFDTPGLEIVCECGDLGCGERLPIERSAYEELRADATLFAVVPGHEIPDVETVVSRTPTYVVVRKHEGIPTDVAERTAP